ncbi:MAG TPA: acyl-CoA thioesterase II [Gammaproteobacteria bacterium]
MNPILKNLIDILTLERLEENLFRGVNHDFGTHRVYGGQVLGQAIRAAQYTVQSVSVHSLHAYFLRMGDLKAPIVYEVDRSRDGKSFFARRVVAIQHGRPIFTLAASFQKAEEGLEYQEQIPQVPSPQATADINTYLESILSQSPEKYRLNRNIYSPFELRPVEPLDVDVPHIREPQRHLWIKTLDRLPDDADLHRSILAYISDFSLLDTNLLPHGLHILDPHVQVASIDHAMWFHREFRIDDWLLYACEGVSASGARGLARGRFFNTDGCLVASTMQEGLIRVLSQLRTQ